MFETLVGKEAPDFTTNIVTAENEIKEMTMKEYKGDDLLVLFSYPLNFTFVCPSEIIAFNNKLEEFTKRSAKVLGFSVDSHFCHLAWKNTPVNQGGIGPINFGLASDLKKEIGEKYGVLTADGVTYRGLFIIDKKNVVRHQLVNDLPLGRNVDEALRMLDAINFHEEHGEVCPANWNTGKAAMKPTAEGVADYLTSNATNL